MRLVFQESDEAWVVLFDGRPVAIGGTTFFISRDDAVAEIGKRGLVVTEDGAILRPDEVDENKNPAPLDEQVPQQWAPVDDDAPELSTAVDEAVDESGQPRRGRPATFSPGEAKERRKDQNRRYYHERPEERKEEVAERSKQWWAEHPDRVREYRERANAKRRQRYEADPEYRERVATANRLYQERRREAAKASQPLSDADASGT